MLLSNVREWKSRAVNSLQQDTTINWYLLLIPPTDNPGCIDDFQLKFIYNLDRSMKVLHCLITLMEVTRTVPVGCVSSAAQDTKVNRTCSHFSITGTSTTERSETFPLAQSCLYGMMTNTQCTWAFLSEYKSTLSLMQLQQVSVMVKWNYVCFSFNLSRINTQPVSQSFSLSPFCQSVSQSVSLSVCQSVCQSVGQVIGQSDS